MYDDVGHFKILNTLKKVARKYTYYYMVLSSESVSIIIVLHFLQDNYSSCVCGIGDGLNRLSALDYELDPRFTN